MRFLLDTCVISELSKKKPTPCVVKWISSVDENNLFISALTIGEIYKGIEKLPDSVQKSTLYLWLTDDLEERFHNRILSFDAATAAVWGTMQAQSELAGKPMPIIDGQIAATGSHHNLIVVTRNISDMKISGVSLYNPWEK
ncbi:MAG: VapC toxin family PIN domain ribonuclease [Deltaproteobacteria bacterium]|nr:MAG: VapC toxin family PIN domain ribonuclease [Deltaproteobacteria bacterium]PIE72998.1 MAG: VapC toxin family PIN domain ribonuclease [Deltaproteobacteria bacterium]